MSQTEPGVFPRFYKEAVEDKVATKEQGRAVFKDQEFIEIRTAGNPKNAVVSKVKDEHKQRFAAAYEAFKRGEEAPVEGMPIEEWGVITRSRAQELKAAEIRTVEALAELPDSRIKVLGPGGRELMKKAKAFLDVSADKKAAMKYATENEKLKEEVTLLKGQLEEMNKAIEQLKGDKAA